MGKPTFSSGLGSCLRALEERSSSYHPAPPLRSEQPARKTQKEKMLKKKKKKSGVLRVLFSLSLVAMFSHAGLIIHSVFPSFQQAGV